MKDILIIIVLLGILGALIAPFILYGPQGVLDLMDAATAAMKAYPFAKVGYLIGTFTGVMLKIEVAKLMFWIHLFI